MIFDKTCKIAERALPKLKVIIDRSRLFHFPGRAHEFLPKEFDEETINFLSTQFMLPFPCVAVEDSAGVVFLIDHKKNIKGVNQLRAYIDVVPFHTPISEFADVKEGEEKRYQNIIHNNPEANKNIYIISSGEIEEVNLLSGSDFYMIGNIKRITIAFADEHKPNKIIMRDTSGPYLKIQYGEEMLNLHLKATLRNVVTALEEIMYANTPNKFIVQEKPAKKIKRTKDRILRSNERPIYTLLKPDEIRTIFKVPNPTSNTGTTKGPHDRRAHPRTFHSDRFIHMQGKTIMIPATWIGPSEKIVGKRHYKVLLDK